MSAYRDNIRRVTRSKQQAVSTYDRLSRHYDFISGPFERGPRNEGLRMLAVQQGERVLEIGFGTGHSVLALARAVQPAGLVYGIDVSRGMLAVTQHRLRNANLRSRVRLRCGDASNLPFQNDFFDAVFMSFTLELFDTPEIPLVLTECGRVLRPGGRLCVVSLSKSGGLAPLTAAYEWLHDRLPALVDCRPIAVRLAIEESGFVLVEATATSLAGLGVEIILAAKPEPI